MELEEILSDEEAVIALKAGYEMLAVWSRNIAMLPLEEWLVQLNRAESLGAVLDPTLFNKYLHSDKAKTIKSLITAAIPLKKIVMEAQDMMRKEIEKGLHD